MWAVSLPLLLLFSVTIVDCRNARFEKCLLQPTNSNLELYTSRRLRRLALTLRSHCSMALEVFNDISLSRYYLITMGCSIVWLGFIVSQMVNAFEAVAETIGNVLGQIVSHELLDT